ncbi:MAG: 23S rRNA (guanosine(2251)-2'-O)-methyltransferase RlmB [Deltaproteobacteria bacterium]|nr:23S rRNA (guanosine(2251)-2'-O)-methyltransferase RlmB [Deltaproteobacteria bacterium]
MNKREIIYGINPVCEALRSGKRRCHVVYIAEGKKDSSLKELTTEIKRSGVQLKNRKRHEIDLMTEVKKHQGVAAEVESFPYLSAGELLELAAKNEKGGLILILDGITDPQNLGSIIRTAHLMGVDGVMIPHDKSAEITPSTVKASAGATEYMPVAKITNVVREMNNLKERGYWIGGASGDGGEELYHHDYKEENTVIVLGSEGSGMRRLVREKCDYLISIPMTGKIDSYNASVAAAIIISEISRQRRK